MVRPQHFIPKCSSSSATRLVDTYRVFPVSRFASDAKAALDRIRRQAEPAALLEPSPEDMPRPGTPTTSIGVQISGTMVRGLVPCSPAALSQALFVGDEIIRVNDTEVTPHNVAGLLGGDKPGHPVQLQVRTCTKYFNTACAPLSQTIHATIDFADGSVSYGVLINSHY